MLSFKKKVLSAWAWAAPALSAVLPTAHERDVGRVNGKLLDLDLQDSYAQATFSVPCNGCLGGDHTSHDDESLILSFKTEASPEACGNSNITLNGINLSQEWNGDFASGSGSYTGVTDFEENAWFLQHNWDLEWDSVCLHGEGEADDAAQVFTVNIKAIDGKPIDKPSGFTLSFKQLSPPELLRLEAAPNPSASNKENAESWREPPAHLRLIVPNAQGEVIQTTGGPPPASLEDDIRELRALQAEVQELQKAIKEKKKHIQKQLRKDVQTFKKELKDCDSITCVVKVVADKAHSAWRIVYVRFRPTHHHDHHHQMGRPEHDPYARVDRPGSHHHGPPPPPPPQSGYVLALEIVLGVLCCGCLFTLIHHRCSSLRTRTERAASREERRNARAYRRAARKLAWRKWWRGNWRDQERIEDYEEKRALIQQQEDVLEDVMQEEIRQLRNAHSVVQDIVTAEEGRAGPMHHSAHMACHCHSHYHHPGSYSPISTASTYPPTSIPELPSRPLSRTDSLPGYRSDVSGDPPAYEEDEDRSDYVVDGFRHYTPSTTSAGSSRWTPESSIIDVSPRPSAETLRYAETTETGVGDAKN
ncbi:hypothetical protein BS50DRAFT_660478 [Corynespora cassiicola Philippines]|uniref:Uncharacterized protein n=1 Tax=Corynespora cassiicola Philippines TaxID=1448308 RepID=A0A2T2P1Z6_CORCC|nr:hypothetical protein BS50DRAFT_660478 [Corynespora cassiicola Philippines]